MTKLALFLFLSLFAITAASAQNQQCLCTITCNIVSDAIPPGPNQPTSCNLIKNGVPAGNSPVVLSSTIPLSNAAFCVPADAPYVPGVAGSVACSMPVSLVAGTYTMTATLQNVAGVGPVGPPFVFDSVAVLPTIPGPATGLHRR